MKLRLSILAAGLALVGSAPALAAARHHHRHCPPGRVARVSYRRERRHGRLVRVRVRRCVLRRHAPPMTPPPALPRPVAPPPTPSAPTVRYETSVDPTFTQSPTDPLAVTYAYSADATSTLAGATTDLAAANQLPAGVLSFYSATRPGGPESLFCSTNVGGATSGASCPITYDSTGTYEVTTQYVPDAATATTQTTEETISPYATTTTTTVSPIACRGWPSNLTYGPGASERCYSLSAAVADQTGLALSADVEVSFGGQDAGRLAVGSTCTLEVAETPLAGLYQHAPISEVYSPDCRTPVGDPTGSFLQAWVEGSDVPSWAIVASYAGTSGWSPSASAPATVASTSPVG